jgi:hypothetical protein
MKNSISALLWDSTELVKSFNSLLMFCFWMIWIILFKRKSCFSSVKFVFVISSSLLKFSTCHDGVINILWWLVCLLCVLCLPTTKCTIVYRAHISHEWNHVNCPHGTIIVLFRGEMFQTFMFVDHKIQFFFFLFFSFLLSIITIWSIIRLLWHNKTKVDQPKTYFDAIYELIELNCRLINFLNSFVADNIVKSLLPGYLRFCFSNFLRAIKWTEKAVKQSWCRDPIFMHSWTKLKATNKIFSKFTSWKGKFVKLLRRMTSNSPRDVSFLKH